MIETFKKWFGKKEEEKEPDNFTYEAIVRFKNGSTMNVVTFYWENPSQASRRFAEALEFNKWIYMQAMSGERVIIKTEDVDRVTVIPKPLYESKKDGKN
ncbi:hypothetical protein Kirov_97 [Bacillus phage Kirov]|uniref:Uncharacterized protein n=1 Tax=Bacillus phage Kirov TaxID=2783539 RepID=A0A7U3NKH9_9CAUD|nr:hypothetical protein PQE67_gp207 [Bacillus phage Kirov]QOV08296.1 hypothetical protein Kirov_97 [Bacillus phage Kirov]